MVTTFNRKDLIEFGQYLLSPERRDLYSNHPIHNGETLEERLKNVSHSDVENFIHNKEFNKKGSFQKMNVSDAIKHLMTGKKITLKQSKNIWYLYKPLNQNIRKVYCVRENSEEHLMSIDELNSNEWIAY